MIRHVCEVCGIEFFNDSPYFPRCTDCYKRRYVRLCLACHQPMTSDEACDGHKYHSRCFFQKFTLSKNP